MLAFSGNRIQSERNEKRTRSPQRRKRKMKTDGAELRLFFFLMMEAQVLLPFHFGLGQVAQLFGLMNWFKCQAIWAIIEEQHPKRHLGITTMLVNTERLCLPDPF